MSVVGVAGFLKRRFGFVKAKNRISRLIHVDKGRLYRKEVREIAEQIEKTGYSFRFSRGLINYMDEKYPGYTFDHILEVHIRHKRTRVYALRELKRAKRLGVSKIKIMTCEDARVCSDCIRKSQKVYNIKRVPLLPLCWECRCGYDPQLK